MRAPVLLPSALASRMALADPAPPGGRFIHTEYVQVSSVPADEKVFDKEDKEMAKTWNVVVRKEDKDNPVRLYCPTCWNTAQEVINSFLENMEEK